MTSLLSYWIQQGIKPASGFSVGILSNRRPYMLQVFDGGGLEVAGHIVSPWWKNLRAWLNLLLNRNIHGLLPFDQSPEPWPNYYLGILEAERSHLEVPWPLDCDHDEPLFKNYPIALRQFSPRDWRRIAILKFGGNPCR
jgi:hypothetical protein